MRIVLLLFAFTSCDTDGELYEEECEKSVLVDNHKFTATETIGYNIQSAEIVGDCLKISFNAGGCSRSNWNIELIDSGVIVQSNPTKRLLKLSLENPELCEALIHREVSFNIRQLRLSSGIITLNLAGYEEELEYSY